MMGKYPIHLHQEASHNLISPFQLLVTTDLLISDSQLILTLVIPKIFPFFLLLLHSLFVTIYFQHFHTFVGDCGIGWSIVNFTHNRVATNWQMDYFARTWGTQNICFCLHLLLLSEPSLTLCLFALSLSQILLLN